MCFMFFQMFCLKLCSVEMHFQPGCVNPIFVEVHFQPGCVNPTFVEIHFQPSCVNPTFVEVCIQTSGNLDALVSTVLTTGIINLADVNFFSNSVVYMASG